MTYIHRYIHRYIHTYIHTYTLTSYNITSIHTYIHQKIQVTFVYLIGDDDRECACETESAKE